MRREVLVVCILCIVAAVAIGVLFVQSGNADKENGLTQTADHVDTTAGPFLDSSPDMSYSPDRMKSAINRLAEWILDVFENKEDYVGDTIEITKRIEVSGGTYVIGKNNTYRFSGDGCITVNEGGTLRMGDSYKIAGDNARIELKKGSHFILFGIDYKAPIDLTLSVKGTLIQFFEISGDVAGPTLNMNVKGTIDLDGTLGIGRLSIEGSSGSELEADIDLGIIVDASSAIVDVKNIVNHIFDLDVGSEINIGVNKLRSSISTLLLSYNVNVESASISLSSPMESSTLILEDVNIKNIVADMTNYLGTVNKALVDIHNVNMEDDEGIKKIKVNQFLVSIESLAETIFDVESSEAYFSIDFGDRVYVTMYSGKMISSEGSFEADLDIREGSDISIYSTDISGNVMIQEGVKTSGVVEMPFRTSHHITVGDRVDASFATDEDAYLSCFLDMDMMTIYPGQGYTLLEFESERYVEYEVEMGGISAIPKSKKGTFYAELGTREYILMAGEEVFMLHATDVVKLPVPEPVPGMIFYGWCDGLASYTDTYEMPAHDVFMNELWTSDTYETEIVSGTFIVRSEDPAMIIQEPLMKEIKTRIGSGEVNTLRMIMDKKEITLQKEDVLATTGRLCLTAYRIFPDLMPERQKVIGNGHLYGIELKDSKGPIEEVSGKIALKVTLTDLNPLDNKVRAYYMDELGRLIEQDCDYSYYTYKDESMDQEETRADITIYSDSLPYYIAYSKYIPVTGISLQTLLISLIPVIVVGIILAFITRRD